MGARDAIIGMLALLTIWFGANVVRLERYHYANLLSMCDQHRDPVQKENCLFATETRTGWGYHLIYGLRIF